MSTEVYGRSLPPNILIICSPGEFLGYPQNLNYLFHLNRINNIVPYNA